MKKEGPVSLSLELVHHNSLYYDNHHWLIPKDERDKIVDLYHSGDLAGIEKLSRKGNVLSLPLSHSIILSNDGTPFVLHSRLGEGKFGKVKIGQNLLTGEFVAIKIIGKKDLLAKDHRMKVAYKLKKEKQILKKVDLFRGSLKRKEAEKKYIILPLIPGKSIELLSLVPIENQPGFSDVPKDLALYLVYVTLIQNLLNEMNAIHEKGILHRDIKPDNVLFLLNGACRLIDFGLSRELESEDYVTDVIGGDFRYLSENLKNLARDRVNHPELGRLLKKYPYSLCDDYHAMYLTMLNLNLIENIKRLSEKYGLDLDEQMNQLIKALNNFEFSGTLKEDYPEELELSGRYLEDSTDDDAESGDNEPLIIESGPQKSSSYVFHKNMIESLRQELPRRIEVLKSSYEKAQEALNEIRSRLRESLKLPTKRADALIETQMKQILNVESKIRPSKTKKM